MKLWLYRHRGLVKSVYIVLAVTVTMVLQILEAQGALP